MKKKRILVDLLNLATSEIAGVGVFAKNLFDVWLKEKDLPYEIVFYSSYVVDVGKVLGVKPAENIRIKEVRLKNVLARFIYQQVVMPFSLLRYDLYFNPTLGIPFLARITAPKAKLAVTIHDMIPFFYPQKYSRLRGMLVKLVSKYAARTAHRVITVSGNSKKDIVSIARINPAKVTIVYNFIPAAFLSSNAINENFFLCISTLEPGKNVENTIRGFARFLEKYKQPVRFYWAGRIGWVYTQEDLDNVVRSENLEGSFVFLGYLDENKKRELLTNCTAIVYLSHYEGFGLPVLEGMMYNKPAVVSNNSSLPEVVGSAGVLCDPLDTESIADAMQQVVMKRAELTRGIPAQVHTFSPEEQLRTFKETVNKLLWPDSRTP
jgi:glycosyltransferase involved in cell wall biosynthesis